MQNATDRKQQLKQKVKNEFKRFLIYTLFFTVLFSMFNIYEKILLKEDIITSIPYEFSFIEALILSKIILIGEAMNLGELSSGKPLIIPVMYKTILFCILVIIFSILEHLIVDLIHSKEISLYELIFRHINVAIARSTVMFFVFFFFFSLLETSHALGEDDLFSLFFRRR
jgi:hypothetical protein